MVSASWRMRCINTNKNKKSHHTTKLPVPRERENETIPGLPWPGHLVKGCISLATKCSNFVCLLDLSTIVAKNHAHGGTSWRVQRDDLVGPKLTLVGCRWLLGLGTGLAWLASPVSLWATSRRQDDLVSPLPLSPKPLETIFTRSPNKQLWCGWGTRSKVGPGPISDAKEELSSPKVLQKISFCRQHFH